MSVPIYSHLWRAPFHHNNSHNHISPSIFKKSLWPAKISFRECILVVLKNLWNLISSSCGPCTASKPGIWEYACVHVCVVGRYPGSWCDSGHLETVEKWKTETENWSDQTENFLLFNTYLSQKTTCKTRPLELQGVIQYMPVLVRGCKIYSITVQLHCAFKFFCL